MKEQRTGTRLSALEESNSVCTRMIVRLSVLLLHPSVSFRLMVSPRLKRSSFLSSLLRQDTLHRLHVCTRGHS